MKIRLPSLTSLRRGGDLPGPPPSGTMIAQPTPIGGFGDRMRLFSRRLRSSAGWVFLAVFVFFAFVWLSLPTRGIAWRIGQQARKAGYLIDIEDMSVRPWGSATLHNVTWTYAPSHPGQIPHQLVLDAVDVDFSVLKYLLLGNIDVEVDTVLDEAPIHAEYARSDSESSIKIEVTELPLGSVPKLQQALGAPLRGLFALHVDMTMPENLFEKAEGTIALECASCSIGDGEELLFIPGSSGITAKGITIPEIDLGTLIGKLKVSEGRATVEDFKTKSADIELELTGDMPLKDPFSKSEFAFQMKLLVTQALQDKSETLRFAVQTAGPSSKMDPPDDGWLGFKLRGTVGKPRFMGIKSKTAEERMLERRQKNAERDAARKSRTKSRSSTSKKTDEKDALERNQGPELPNIGGDTGGTDREPEKAPDTEMRQAEPPSMPSTQQPPPEPEPEQRQEERPPEPPPPLPPAMEEVQPEGGQGQGQGDGQGQPEAQPDGQMPAEPSREGEAPPSTDAPTG
ncbi:type II secretion system protein GspN [Nannocystis bainbridge]|uniref:Type II secretion system protein GspN n=1 Tax=Nannocystis bainbridge TaxID=2995303 RepID=A0ABT5E072_9BACT|nr:type II secretion system protein GspN [Nannocystis bainbridge]MDC0719277.1 type II secretion system protein GspN [Nannocystis bainbridge]